MNKHQRVENFRWLNLHFLFSCITQRMASHSLGHLPLAQWLSSFFKINLYWGIVDLQCCVSFSCRAQWISYTLHIFIPFPYRSLQSIETSSLCCIVQFSSVAQSCPTLCDPMNCSTPGLPVHHQLPEFTHTHVHRVDDVIHPSHPLLSPSPPAPNPSQHQSLFQWVNSSHEVAKVLRFQL